MVSTRVLPSQVVRQVERIGLMSTGKKQYSTVFEDNLDQDTTVSVLLMQHTDNEVQKLSVCPSTGNVAVYNDFDIILDHFDCFELDLRGHAQP